MALSALPDPADKAAVVQAMFDRIAPRYDLLNRLFTCRLDQRWRRLAIQAAGIAPGDRVVDLGCGTGDLLALAAAAGGRPVGIDFAAGMLGAARRRGVAAELVRADAGALPLANACAHVVISAFALRNFVSIPAVLREAVRVLAPDGRLVILEVDEPRQPLLRWGHARYFRRIVPAVGGWLSDRAAYAYLPQSTVYLPAEAALLAALREAGFASVTKRVLSGGIAQLWRGIKQ